MKSKIVSESIGLVLGFILGGTIGLGTIIIILGVAPMMEYLEKPCDNLFDKLSENNKSVLNIN